MSEELEKKKSQFKQNENDLRAMVDKHRVNEFKSSLFVVKWKSIKIKEKLGSGAFSTVFKGVWRGSQVAVKKPIFSENGLLKDDFVDIFKREVKMLTKLRHINIVTLMAVCLDKENMCLLLELCKSDLHTILLDHSIILPPKKLLGFAIDISQALLYLHTNKPPMIHRDIKSSNVLINSYGIAKISDFGYSTYLNEHDFVFNKHKITKRADKGTPAYMAIECLKNDNFSTKSDVFSFGVILWELMTRVTPWAGKAPESIYAEITTGSRLEVPLDTDFPESYIKLMTSCWLEDPNDRPSMKIVLQTLKKINKTLNF